MTPEPHVIEIDSIVLPGTGAGCDGVVLAGLRAELLRALTATSQPDWNTTGSSPRQVADAVVGEVTVAAGAPTNVARGAGHG